MINNLLDADDTDDADLFFIHFYSKSSFLPIFVIVIHNDKTEVY